MDLCAELTLHVLRFVQQPADPPCSPREWQFIPECRSSGWIEARKLLAAAPKPLMIGPLSEPGMVGWWHVGAMSDPALARVKHNFVNQQQWLEEGAEQHGWAADDRILFESAADTLEVPLAEIRRWLKEYAILVGWTVGKGPDDARPGRLLIRRANGEWSPGWQVALNAADGLQDGARELV